jgi:hypothetical protein
MCFIKAYFEEAKMGEPAGCARAAHECGLGADEVRSQHAAGTLPSGWRREHRYGPPHEGEVVPYVIIEQQPKGASYGVLWRLLMS